MQKFTSLYELSIETVEEFNQVNGADNIKMKNSIVVNAKLNLKLYAALSVILFLFLGCFCAIFLGRLGDFVDYYLYVDKKSGLPNRERCDAMVDRYSTVRLNGQFTVIHIQVDLSGMSRNDGDKALRALGDQLQYVFRTLGFVGYNGADTSSSCWKIAASTWQGTASDPPEQSVGQDRAGRVWPLRLCGRLQLGEG